MIFQNCLTTLLIATTFCVLFNTKTCSAKPGLSVKITKRGFDYATTVCMNKLYEMLQEYQIPDTKGRGRKYKVYNMKIISVSKPSGEVALVPGKGLTWLMTLKNLQINGDWKYKTKVLFFTCRLSGSVRFALSDIRIKITLAPTKGNNGSLNVRATSCSCKMKVKISVNKIIMRILLYIYKYKSKIRNKIQDKFCNEAVSAINSKVARSVSHYPATFSFAGNYVFDYRLESKPEITDNYMQINNKAMVYYENDQRTIPFIPNDLPIVSEDKKMLYFLISNYVLDTWSFAAHQNNVLKYKLMAQNLTEESPDLLQTTCPDSFCFGSVMPQLETIFPNSTIQIDFSTSDRPRINFRPNRIQMNVPTLLDFSVLLSNTSLVNVFNIHLNCSAEMNARLKDNQFLFSLSNMSFTLGNITGDFAGEYQLEPLQKALQMVGDLLVPYINSHGASGIPIVFPKKTYISNPEFRVVNNAIILGTDLKIGE